MNPRVHKTRENKNQLFAATPQKNGASKPAFNFVDNRNEASIQQKQRQIANDSPQSKKISQLQAMLNHHFKQQSIRKNEITSNTRQFKKLKHKGHRLLKADRPGWQKIEFGMNHRQHPSADGTKNTDGYFYEFSKKTQFSTIYYRTKIMPFPTEVLNFDGKASGNDASVGLTVKINFTANTGDNRDIFNVEESEKVSASTNHTGIFTHKDNFQSSNSDYMTISEVRQDRHWAPKDELASLAKTHQPADSGPGDEIGHYEVKQHDTYHDEDNAEKIIASSGYCIKRKVFVKAVHENADNDYYVITEKEAEAVGGAKAGPSEKQEATSDLQ